MRHLSWIKLLTNPTLSDYMITIFQVRHSGMDSHQAILPDALGLMQICSRQICAGIHDCMDAGGRATQEQLPRSQGRRQGNIPVTGYPHPGGYDGGFFRRKG